MKLSDNYASKWVLAEELARLECRAVTLTAVAKTKPLDSRQVVRKVNGAQSLSGQTPTDHQWYFGNRNRRLQGAFLALLYYSYRTGLANSHDAHALAFAMALRDYTLLVKNREITGERFNLLIGQGFSRTWREIPSGGTTGFEYDNARIMACKVCRIPHLVEAHFVSYTCSQCS